MKTRNDGFTMIEFIVYVGGLGLVSLLISTLIMATQKHLLETRLSLNIEEINGHIILALSNPVACHQTFGTISRGALVTNVENIRNSFGTVLYTSPSTPYQNIRIQSMRANNFQTNPAAAAPAPFTGTFDLVVVYRVTINTATGATQDRTRTITVRTRAPAVGNNLSRTPERCTSGTSTGFGYDPNFYVQRDRYDNTAKQGDLTVQGTFSTVQWAPGGFTPTQSGTLRAYTGVYTISDKRFKTDIKPLKIPWDEAFSSIEGKEFTWKETGQRDYGFLAQDVEKVFPELIIPREKDGIKKVNYFAFIPIMHESYKKMDSENKDIEKRLNALEKKIGRKKK